MASDLENAALAAKVLQESPGKENGSETVKITGSILAQQEASVQVMALQASRNAKQSTLDQ